MTKNLRDDFRDCVARGDGAAMGRISNEIEDSQLGLEVFLEENFTLIEEALLDPTFRALRDGWKLFLVLHFDEEKLSETQRTRLRVAIIEAFGKFDDWMGTFYLSEILGKLFADESGITMLEGLLDIEDERNRAFVAHAFEHVVEEAEGSIRDRAFQVLVGMAHDPSPTVLGEVALSLWRLKGAVSENHAAQIDSTLDMLRAVEEKMLLP